jgi:hypothetical protein
MRTWHIISSPQKSSKRFHFTRQLLVVSRTSAPDKSRKSLP